MLEPINMPKLLKSVVQIIQTVLFVKMPTSVKSGLNAKRSEIDVQASARLQTTAKPVKNVVYSIIQDPIKKLTAMGPYQLRYRNRLLEQQEPSLPEITVIRIQISDC